jgi:hypothetical protein
MEPKDLNRIRFVTRNLNELRGLLNAVYGMLLVAIGCAYELLGRPRGGVLYLPLLLALWGFERRAKSYYRTRFGEVEPRRNRTSAWNTNLWVAAALFPASWTPDVPTFDSTLYIYTLAVLGFLCKWAKLGAPRSGIHYPVLGALLFGLAAWSAPAGGGLASAWILCGSAWVLAGLLDHRLLVRTLPPLPAAVQKLEPAAQAEGQGG